METSALRKHIPHPTLAILASILLLLAASTTSFGQKNAILVQMDNDYLTDQYYTAGLSVEYFRSISSGQASKALQKQLIIGYDFQIYTPSIYDEESYVNMTQDRPFAGGHFLSSSLRVTSKPNKVQEYGISGGFIGPQAQAEEIQRFFHTTFGFYPEIVGWENQISSQWVINLDYRWLKEWRLNEDVAISTSSSVELGMVENSFQQRINFRVGQFKDLHQSSWISPKRASSKENFINESYINFGWDIKYVGSNVFLEGTLSHSLIPMNIEPQSFIFSGSLGIYIGSPKLNFALDGIFQGREFSKGKGHFYLALIIGKAF